MTITLPSYAVRNRAEALAKAANPLQHFRCSSSGQEEVIRHVVAKHEVYAHAAQRSGKSTIGAALTAAFTRGHEYLVGRAGERIALPVLRPPVRWVLGFDSYKLGGASVMHSLRAMLGVEDEDYREDMAGGASGCPSVIRVRHAKARSESDWSSIYVFPYGGDIPRSMELDGWWCDEPPPILYLEALRSRLGAHRDLRGYITATPVLRVTWGPIKEQYPKEEREVSGGRVRIRWSVFDNDALSNEAKESLKARASGSAYEMAYLYGEHVDATGDCPWAADLLNEWHAKTYRGRLQKITVTDERDDTTEAEGGPKRYEITPVIEQWGDPHPDASYLILVDAASGTRRADHDPSGVHVWDRTTRTLVARFGQIPEVEWNGYVGSYGAGCIAAHLAKLYSAGGVPGLVAVENNGWGLGAMTALREMGHRRVARERPVDSPGRQASRWGFITSERTRPMYIAALEQALQRRDARIPSPEVIRCLKDCVIDAKGKIVAGPSYHDEDMILAGAALHLMGTHTAPEPPRRKTEDEQLAEEVEKRLLVPARVRRVSSDRW